MSERDELRQWLDSLRILTDDNEPLSGALALAKYCRALHARVSELEARLATPVPTKKSKTAD